MPATEAPFYDERMFPTLKSLALETLFELVAGAESERERRIAAIAALRYLAMVEDPRRKPRTPATPLPPPPTDAPQPPPPRDASTPRQVPAAAATGQAPSQTRAPSADSSTESPAEPTAAVSPPRLIHSRAKRNPHSAPLLPGGNPHFVSTFAPAFLNNPTPSGPRDGASP